MRQLRNWILILTKRLLRKPFFLIILLLPLCGGVVMSAILPKLRITIPVGITTVASAATTEEDAALSRRIQEDLLSHNGLVEFHLYDSAESLAAAVEGEQVQCGYVIPDNLRELILKEETEGAITVYEAPNTLVTSVVNELVVGSFFQEMAFETLLSDTEGSGVFPSYSSSEIRELMTPFYEMYTTGDATLQFDYNRSIDEEALTPDYAAYLTQPCLGIVSLFILLAAFGGCILWYQDNKTGVFVHFTKGRERVIRYIYALLPALFTAVSGLLFLWMCGLIYAPLRNCFALILYSILTALAAWLLTCIIGNLLTYTAMIPVLVIGSIVCTPMFFSAKTWLPIIGYIQYIFPPFWCSFLFG